MGRDENSYVLGAKLSTQYDVKAVVLKSDQSISQTITVYN